MDRMQSRGRPWSTAAEARLEPLAVASLSLGAAAIHFGVIAEHFAEYFLFGLFFSIIGWFQALWAVAYVIRPARLLVLLGIVVNAATVLIWAWAHLIGLPFGPDPGEVEPTTMTDLMATLFELLLIAWLLVIAGLGTVRRANDASPSEPSTGPGRVVILVALMVAIALGTTVALAQPPM